MKKIPPEIQALIDSWFEEKNRTQTLVEKYKNTESQYVRLLKRDGYTVLETEDSCLQPDTLEAKKRCLLASANLSEQMKLFHRATDALSAVGIGKPGNRQMN